MICLCAVLNKLFGCCIWPRCASDYVVIDCACEHASKQTNSVQQLKFISKTWSALKPTWQQVTAAKALCFDFFAPVLGSTWSLWVVQLQERIQHAPSPAPSQITHAVVEDPGRPRSECSPAPGAASGFSQCQHLGISCFIDVPSSSPSQQLQVWVNVFPPSGL